MVFSTIEPVVHFTVLFEAAVADLGSLPLEVVCSLWTHSRSLLIIKTNLLPSVEASWLLTSVLGPSWFFRINKGSLVPFPPHNQQTVTILLWESSVTVTDSPDRQQTQYKTDPRCSPLFTCLLDSGEKEKHSHVLVANKLKSQSSLAPPPRNIYIAFFQAQLQETGALAQGC